MTGSKADLINYRLERAQDTYEEKKVNGILSLIDFIMLRFMQFLRYYWMLI